MARLNVQTDRVQTLIRDSIAPAFLVSRSVAALTKALNDSLAKEGVERTIHPNRLHSLLSDDMSRGLNEATLGLVEQAVAFARKHDKDLDLKAQSSMEALRGEAAKLKLYGALTSFEISQKLAIPPAIARQLTTNSEPSLVANSLATPKKLRRTEPDWSYQDTAVSRCLDALARRPTGRVGLVLPTGAGKTRVALRVALTVLARHSNDQSVVVWVTHRKNLRQQAHGELQKMIAARQPETLLGDPISLESRIRFVMLGGATDMQVSSDDAIALVVIDEAHHAAAPSYQRLFDEQINSPALLLTATPNRTDGLPIGIDEIAYTTTYRELAERGAILRPEFIELPVADFDWSPEAVDDLVDYVVGHSRHQFKKVLVLAPRIERVREFYEAVVSRLSEEQAHPLTAEEVGYIVGEGNSHGIDNEDFLSRFASLPRAILVSAQLLLEGFDDPAIDTVVLTYPSSSVIRLMQAAGRCVRYSPGKTAAYVVQAKNTDIAYHFDQRWLYQDIDDYLRPQLDDIEYGTADQLREAVESALLSHRVDERARARIAKRVADVQVGETCRLFLYGLPYYASQSNFDDAAKWSAVLESPSTSAMLRAVFNGFCALGADIPDPSDFLLRDAAVYGMTRDLSPGSAWKEMMGLLTSAYLAKQEMSGDASGHAAHRPYKKTGASTWLRYVTFTYRPAVSSELSVFLADCHNAPAVEGEYLRAPEEHVGVVKTPLPLGGAEAYLLGSTGWQELQDAIQTLRGQLGNIQPSEQCSNLASFLEGASFTRLPNRLLRRVEFLLPPAAWTERTLLLSNLAAANPEEQHD